MSKLTDRIRNYKQLDEAREIELRELFDFLDNDFNPCVNSDNSDLRKNSLYIPVDLEEARSASDIMKLAELYKFIKPYKNVFFGKGPTGSGWNSCLVFKGDTSLD